MNKKQVFKVAVISLSTILIVPATSNAIKNPTSTSGEYFIENVEAVEKVKPYIQVYDEKGSLIKAYSDEEIKGLFMPVEIPQKNSFKETFFFSYYDENGKLIDSSDEDLVEAHERFEAELKNINGAPNHYYMGDTSFTSNVWIGQGRTFHNPVSVWFQTEGYLEAMSIIVHHKDGEQAGRVEIGGFHTSLYVPINHLTKGEGDYRIQLKNSSQHKSINFKGGGAYYW
jgi:hypothetical protein